MTKWIALVFLLLMPALASAHPGHGHTDPASVTHYVTEPVHVLPLALAVALIVVVAAAGFWLWRARRD
jgi:hypothetical protein